MDTLTNELNDEWLQRLEIRSQEGKRERDHYLKQLKKHQEILSRKLAEDPQIFKLMRNIENIKKEGETVTDEEWQWYLSNLFNFNNGYLDEL